ncbi:MAG: glycosyltransferase family 4 protein [Kineosporiaceae bacterium]
MSADRTPVPAPGPGPAGSARGRRILLVLGTSAGGVGRHVRALADGLAAAGADIRVAGPEATRDTFGFDGFEAVEMSDRPRPTADLSAVRRLRTLARTADVVHAHGLRAGALAVLARTGLRGDVRPGLVVTLHNALVSGGRVAAVHAVLERLVARGADAVLVVSGDLGDRMQALHARRVERALVPAPDRPGTATADRGAVRAGLGVPDGTALLLTVARLAPQKGLGLLLDAVAALQAADGVPPVLAVVAGDGPLRSEVRAAAAARDLAVRLIGRRDDVPALLAAADVVVVPSLWEGQPLVVQEALRAGAVVVATDVGGTREVAGDAALLVPGGNAQALAAALARAVTEPGVAADLRARALARAAALPSDADAVAQVVTVYAAVRAAAHRTVGRGARRRTGRAGARSGGESARR